MSNGHFVPPYLLETIAGQASDDHVLACVRDTLHVDDSIRAHRRAAAATPVPDGGVRTVSDAEHTAALPGRVVRAEGDPATGDAATDEAYDGMGASRALFTEVFGRDSLDNRGHPLHATVHYRRSYANAFWDGERLVFGDGDGTIFERFTKPLDVIAHEFTHGVVQFTAGLFYEGQSGSLNESLSDVFASVAVQRLRGESVDEASWLIGEGLFKPTVNARALRSMAQPGTAYDDPQLGRDPQPGRMSDFVETTDDNGGVHINSGIPNRAFHLAATALGGPAWERAGKIWYAALTDARLPAHADFAVFADLTVAIAAERHGRGSVEHHAVADAWRTVEVRTAAGTARAPASAPDTATGRGRVVVVRRTGGFAGLVTERRLDTGVSVGGARVEQLLGRVDLRAVRSHTPQPDAFVFTIAVGDTEVTVQESDLPEELAEVVGTVLHEGEDTGRGQPRSR